MSLAFAWGTLSRPLWMHASSSFRAWNMPSTTPTPQRPETRASRSMGWLKHALRLGWAHLVAFGNPWIKLRRRQDPQNHQHCIIMNYTLLHTGWCFGTFFIFPYIGNNNNIPNWLIFCQRCWNHQPAHMYVCISIMYIDCIYVYFRHVQTCIYSI